MDGFMSDIVELKEDVSSSDLYSEDLAPVPASGRTWNLWNITAIWIGMAVCIPTYLLASYMIKDGLGWGEALFIIFLANLIVTVPMIFNGHAGVKYGIPFPVLARAAFGIRGVHIPAIVRAIVACGWFGIQTWIGGLAIYAIACAVFNTPYVNFSDRLVFGQFAGFAVFWCMNLYFIWKGTESIRWLETFAAPILIVIGLVLIGWGATQAGGFRIVLDQSAQMQNPTASVVNNALRLKPLKDLDGRVKADEFCAVGDVSQLADGVWNTIPATGFDYPLSELGIAADSVAVSVQFRKGEVTSSVVTATPPKKAGNRWLAFFAALTGMVGFWATMSISIADITRYAHRQKEQVMGQLIGLPPTMLLFSFVGVFVTCASLILFSDILVAEDAPWDPVSLLTHFDNRFVVICAQLAMLIATLSTNIAANVIAPANAFANAFPKKVSFAGGGLITGIIGIVLCPWWLIGRVAGLLITVSGFLGPVLGVMLADYFLVRGTELDLAALYKRDGIYNYRSGFNPAGMIAMTVGVLLALVGYFIPALNWLYNFAWFIGFFVSFFLYYLMMGKVKVEAKPE